jgi:hypothetical protein
MVVPHYAYLLWRILGPSGPITVSGSFTLSDKCDKDFNRISKSFGMHAEYETTKLTTNHDVLPDAVDPCKSNLSTPPRTPRKCRVHPTDPKKTTSIATNLDRA